MKQTVDFYAFRTAFEQRNRFDQFGHDGLSVLFDYLTDWESDCGEELELDVIALCCDYSHDTMQQVADSHDIDLSDCETLEERWETVREWLSDNTSLCGETDTGFVYLSSF